VKKNLRRLTYRQEQGKHKEEKGKFTQEKNKLDTFAETLVPVFMSGGGKKNPIISISQKGERGSEKGRKYQ